MFSRFSELNRYIQKSKSAVSFAFRFFAKDKVPTPKNPNKLRLNTNTKNARDTKSSENKGGPDKKPTIEPLLVLIPSFLTFGLILSLDDIRTFRNVKRISLTEFEKDFLLNGEVKALYYPAAIAMLFSNVTCYVTLHTDIDRPFQNVAIENIQTHNITSLVREIELKLGLRKEETIPINRSWANIPIVASLLMINFFILKKLVPTSTKPAHTKYRHIRFKKISNKSSKTKETKETNENKETTEKKAGQTSDTRNIFDRFAEFLEPGHISFDLGQSKPNIKFKDVAGLHEAKIEVKEFLDYLRYSDKFRKLGARLPRGALLLGPPGCGKTLLIKALASESDVPFLYYAGTDFTDIIGGVGAKKMRKLFDQARREAPVIIFIDEIDSIGRQRSGANSEGDLDTDQTLNQLLVEMDGMDSNAGIVVFAATNRGDILDKALTRPGRFDRHIYINLPVLEERKEIFLLYLTRFGGKLDADINELKDKLAQKTPGMTGADIANLCNEAALTAAKFDYRTINEDCFEQALERIIAGAAKKNRILNDQERRIVAYQEAGHALASWLLKYADPVIRVSIVARTDDRLGFTHFAPSEKYLKTEEMLIDEMSVLLGGRVAESIKFNNSSSADVGDLKKVKDIAYTMIREYGMSQKIGHLSYQIDELDIEFGSYPYSENTRQLMDMEANKMVSSAYKRTQTILQDNFEKLELIANELLAKEVLKNTDIQALIGPRPHDVT